MLIINIIIVASNIATTSSTKEVYKTGNGYTELEKQIIALQEPLQIQRQQEITALKNKIEQELTRNIITPLEKIVGSMNTNSSEPTLDTKKITPQDTVIFEKTIETAKELNILSNNITQLTVVQIKKDVQTNNKKIAQLKLEINEINVDYQHRMVYILQSWSTQDCIYAICNILKMIDQLLPLMEQKEQKEQVLQKAENKLQQITALLQQLPQTGQQTQQTQQTQQVMDQNHSLQTELNQLKEELKQQKQDNSEKVKDAGSVKHNIDDGTAGLITGTAGIIIGTAGIIFSTTSSSKKSNKQIKQDQTKIKHKLNVKLNKIKQNQTKLNIN